MAAAAAPPPLAAIREYVLAKDRHACVARELWNDGCCTYHDLRNYIRWKKEHDATRNRLAPRLSVPATSGAGGTDTPRTPLPTPSATTQPGFQPTSYTFVGMRCLFDSTKCAITLVKFANVRSDLLAYADVEGGLWVVRDLHAQGAMPIKAPQVHRRAITSLDWSTDNTYLLTAGLDGLTVWIAETLDPVRTFATPVPSSAIAAAIFHPLSANVVIAGTASALVEALNVSTGATTLSVPLSPKPAKGVVVSALECSAHHVFVGDSAGWVHAHRQDIPREGQLGRLVHVAKLRVPAGGVATPVIAIQHLAFCTAVGSAALLVTARDSTVAIVKVSPEGRLEMHTRCVVAPMAREVRAAVCPLSMMHCDLPRVVMGSEDTGVHIYNLSGVKAGHSTGRSGGLLLGLGAAPGRPLLVNTLRGHRAPVPTVSWAYDESLLASADCDGMCIVWERAAG